MTNKICVKSGQCFLPRQVTHWLPDPRRWSFLRSRLLWEGVHFLNLHVVWYVKTLCCYVSLYLLLLPFLCMDGASEFLVTLSSEGSSCWRGPLHVFLHAAFYRSGLALIGFVMRSLDCSYVIYLCNMTLSSSLLSMSFLVLWYLVWGSAWITPVGWSACRGWLLDWECSIFQCSSGLKNLYNFCPLLR